MAAADAPLFRLVLLLPLSLFPLSPPSSPTCPLRPSQRRRPPPRQRQPPPPRASRCFPRWTSRSRRGSPPPLRSAATRALLLRATGSGRCCCRAQGRTRVGETDLVRARGICSCSRIESGNASPVRRFRNLLSFLSRSFRRFFFGQYSLSLFLKSLPPSS